MRQVELKVGEFIFLRNGSGGQLGNREALYTGTSHTHPIIRLLTVGERVFIDDGNIILEVAQRVSETELNCKVLQGGFVLPNKGVNIPDSKAKIAAVTEKDMEDARFIAPLDFDLVAMSFVSQGSDIAGLRRLLKSFSPRGKMPPRIIAKIEKPLAMEHLDSIVAEADGCMVARGDMAVECGIYVMPGHQRDIIARCKAAHKFVIVATDLMKSMIELPYPQRSEVSDVAHAVFDGADAVMLSGESSAGLHPVACVRAMRQACADAEKSMSILGERVFPRTTEPAAADALTEAKHSSSREQLSLQLLAALVSTRTHQHELNCYNNPSGG